MCFNKDCPFLLCSHKAGIVIRSVILISVLLILILASVPPVSRDALTHHLAVPKLYLENGGIVELPSVPFSYYPMNIDLLYLLPLYFGNDIIPKYIHFSFALLTALIMMSYLRRRLNEAYALLGALLFITIPIIVKLSITVYVDLGLIFFSTASLLLVLKWLESGFKFRYLLFSALCCGLALGTKYNALILIVILPMFVASAYSEQSSEGVQKSLGALWFGALFVFLSLLVFSPWMIKNFKWTGNPVYPLYSSLFNVEKTELVEETETSPSRSGRRMGHFAFRRIIYEESLWDVLLIPLRVFFQGRDDDPEHFDGKLNPLLALLPIFAFINRKKKETKIVSLEKKILLCFSLLYLIFVFLLRDMRIRYISVIIPPLVILCMFGLRNIHSLVNEFGNKLPVKGNFLGLAPLVIILCFITLNGKYVQEQFKKIDPISYLAGEVSRREYIGRYVHEYSLIEYINENSPKSSKILCIFLGNRRYYSNRDMVFEESMLKEMVIHSESGIGILEKLDNQGITHLLIRYDLFSKWINDNFTYPQRTILDEFFQKFLVLLFQENGFGLFSIKSPP